MFVTLKDIRDHSPCVAGWNLLLSHLKKCRADTEPLSLKTILESNGLDDALWCLRALEGYVREKRLYAVWCAQQVQHLDPKLAEFLKLTEKYTNNYICGSLLGSYDELLTTLEYPHLIYHLIDSDASVAARSTANEALFLSTLRVCSGEEYVAIQSKVRSAQEAKFIQEFCKGE